MFRVDLYLDRPPAPGSGNAPYWRGSAEYDDREGSDYLACLLRVLAVAFLADPGRKAWVSIWDEQRQTWIRSDRTVWAEFMAFPLSLTGHVGSANV